MAARLEFPAAHPHVAVVTIDRPAHANALEMEKPPTIELVEPATGEVLSRGEGAPLVRGQWSRVGLVLPENLPFDDWQYVGSTLKAIEGSVLWWLGDWCAYGERVYGEQYSQALDATDYSYQTLVSATYVAQNVALLRRRNNLSWSHHREVASLSPDEQIVWLDAATSQGWSQKELRREIKHAKRIREDAAAASALDLRASISQADALTWLGTLSPGSVDLLLTDPPYATDIDDIDTFARAWLTAVWSTLARHGLAYIFTGAYPHELHAYLTAIAETKPTDWTRR